MKKNSTRLLLPLLITVMLHTPTLWGQIKHVEPPFWWEGMNRSEVQILIHGDNIGKLDAKVDGLPVVNVLKTDNPNFLFVTIETKGAKAGSYAINLKEKDETKHSYSYELKQRREGSAMRKGFDASDVIYLIMPDRFANGDPSNDSHSETIEKADRNKQGGRHGGDLQGIIDHLDYIKSLGATAIWNTPLLEDNEPTYSYHTYAQSDFYKIDPRYGTNELYARLATEMHKRDMKLIMDYVTNHWGKAHWMMADPPTYDWIHRFDGFTRSNYRITTQYDPYVSYSDDVLSEKGWFDTSMPDMNQSNPLVLTYQIQNAIWWVEYADLDGLRVDTYPYNHKEGIATWTRSIMEEYPNFNIVGESWLHNQAQIAYWQKDSKIAAIDSYNTYCPSVMDFTLHDAIMVVFGEDEQKWTDGVGRIYENFVNDFLYTDVNNIMVFAENHDTDRINNIYPDFAKYKMVMTLIATVRGIPQLYYGSEVGMTGSKAKGDGDIRRDFPGGWEGDEANAFEASRRTKRQKQYFDFTSKLFQWRKNSPVIHHGKTTHYVPENNVYVYFRHTSTDKVMVVLNNNPNDLKIDLSRFKVSIGDATKGKDVLTDKKMNLSKSIDVGGKTALIIEVE